MAIERDNPYGTFNFLVDIGTGDTQSCLLYTSWQIGGRGPLFAALRAASSGVYGFRSLPGLEAYVRDERPLTDYCADADAPPTYYLAIEDRQRRFLPQLHRLCLPKAALTVLPLYSNPARALGRAVGALRGQVVQKGDSDPAPAPYAIVTARFGTGPVYETVSDERGAFALFVPYPKPNTPPGQWTAVSYTHLGDDHTPIAPLSSTCLPVDKRETGFILRDVSFVG